MVVFHQMFQALPQIFRQKASGFPENEQTIKVPTHMVFFGGVGLAVRS